MRNRMPVLVVAGLLLAPTFASAQGADYGADYVPRSGQPSEATMETKRAPSQPIHYAGFDPVARDAWLADCRQKVAMTRRQRRDTGLGGALIGGAVGAIAGNQIAGRGNRTEGTLIGAGVGAVAGYAIDRAKDQQAAAAPSDECEAYLADYYQRYTRGGYAPYYAAQGQTGTAYTPPRNEAACPKLVEYVYVEETAAPRRAARRVMPARPEPARSAAGVTDKRIPIR